jgi:hypothetical protein
MKYYCITGCLFLGLPKLNCLDLNYRIIHHLPIDFFHYYHNQVIYLLIDKQAHQVSNTHNNLRDFLFSIKEKTLIKYIINSRNTK